MKNTRIWGVMALLILLFLLGLPARAQEATGPDTAPTAEARPEIDAPVILAVATEESDSGGDVTVTVNLPPADSDPADSGQPTNPESPTSPIYYVIVLVLATLLVGMGIYGARITKFLATLVPPETASSIYQSGVRFGLQVALNQAAQTPSPLDDEFFAEMARLRGLTVTKKLDGSYDVLPLDPSPAAG